MWGGGGDKKKFLLKKVVKKKQKNVVDVFGFKISLKNFFVEGWWGSGGSPISPSLPFQTPNK